MNIRDEYAMATKFFDELAEKLKDTHEVVGSCNQDFSRYLIPKGTANQISYYGKPENSYRISDHWNWYSSLRKCKDKNMVQCNNIDLPNARRRDQPGKASVPRMAVCVAYYGDDHVYHTIFGQKFDKKNYKYYFIE